MNDLTINSDCMECPYCGDKDYDAWENYQDSEESVVITCEECGKKFKGKKHISIDYRGEVDEELEQPEEELKKMEIQ